MNAILICKEITGGVPTEIQVIPHGYHDTPKGDFLCDEESARLVIEEFNKLTNDMVADYEHQTLAGVEAPAAGWIKKLVNKGKDGVWAMVEWTDRAKAFIANREYRYVSPVFLKRLSDKRVTRLINVALTNQPNIDGMVPIVNKTLPAHGEGKPKKEVEMKKVLEALGLKEDATEDAAVKAIAGLKGSSAVVASKAVCDALGVKEGAGESEVVGTVMAMKQGFSQTDALTKKVVGLEARLREKDAEDIVALAMKEGKIPAAQLEWAKAYAAKDPEGFKVFAAKAAPVVPMGGMPKGETDGKAAVDEAQMQVNKMLGITDETFKKHNPKEA